MFDVFIEWKTMIEKKTGKSIKTLRTNNSHEFVDKTFLQYCTKEGIVRHITCVGRPQQNSVAERMNKALLKRARHMNKLSKRFWAETTTCYLVNRSPHAALNFKSPQEVWYNLPIDYSNLRVLDCPTYIHMSEEKLERKVRKCIFMGYDLGVKGYRVWCEKSKKIITFKDVVFDEHALITPIVKVSFTNTAGTSNDTKKEVEPNIDEIDDNAQHEKQTALPTPREKWKIIPYRRYIEECDYVTYVLIIAIC